MQQSSPDCKFSAGRFEIRWNFQDPETLNTYKKQITENEKSMTLCSCTSITHVETRSIVLHASLLSLRLHGKSSLNIHINLYRLIMLIQLHLHFKKHLADLIIIFLYLLQIIIYIPVLYECFPGCIIPILNSGVRAG